MRFSFLRFVQWTGIAIVLVALVGLNFNFESKASKTVNAPVENSLSQSMRGSWFLDDGSGTNVTDASGNGNTLAMTGSPSWVAGQIGPYSLDFSGSGQYLSVADPASGVLDFGDGADFTISGWFNRDTAAADHTIVAKKNDQTTNAGYVVWIDNNGSTDYLSAEISDGTDTYSAIGTTDLSSTGWHHFSIVWDDSNGLSIYLDGKLDGSTTSSTSSINSLANALAFTIGAESDAGVPFDGKIDNITLYGRALSTNEVSTLYQTAVPIQPVDTGLVGHWTFDGNDVDWGNTSTEIKDVSGKGNDGDASGLTTASAVRGKLGQALSFDGSSDYVASDVPVSGNITLAAWIYPTSGSGEYSGIITRPNQYTYGNYKVMFRSGGQYIQFLFDGGSSHVTHAISLNQWTHVAVSFDDSANTVSMYLNGSIDTADTETASMSTANGYYGTLIGAGNTVYSDVYFEGKIDDVRIYNRALSATEVANLYNVGR